jgi:hypothetical protein
MPNVPRAALADSYVHWLRQAHRVELSVQRSRPSGLRHGARLVWRRADNWTAFADGASAWINGCCKAADSFGG